MVQEKLLPNLKSEDNPSSEAQCLYALMTNRRPVSRRNRASWYLRQLNKLVSCDPVDPFNISTLSINAPTTDTESIEKETDIEVISITSNDNHPKGDEKSPVFVREDQQFLVTPNTRVLFLSKSIATSVILDLSPSVVSVSPQNGCVFLDSIFDALKRVLHLLVKTHEIPSTSTSAQPFVLESRVFVSVIAYTPLVVAKNNQVLLQNRRISSSNIDQVLVEIWIYLNRLIQELQELVSSTCGMNLDLDPRANVFVFPQPISGSVMRHPGSVLEDIFELGLFSSSLMPGLSRLSILIISDGLFSSTNDLNIFRLKGIAVSFVSLGAEDAYPDSCFGYTPYIDLMKFISKTTQGVYLAHKDLLESSCSLSKVRQVPLLRNVLYKLLCYTLHDQMDDNSSCETSQSTELNQFESSQEPTEVDSKHLTRYFCIDQSSDSFVPKISRNQPLDRNYHDWRSFRQLDRNLDADFEQVLACLLREGYLIKSVQFKHKDTTRIVARLVLHWRHNLDLEQELTAPYWSNTDPFDMNESNQLILRPFNTPLYGDTYCELFVHGSYSFLHNLYCDKRTKRRSEYRDLSYKQYRQLIDGVLQTHERLQYLSRFYRDSSLSKVPSFLLHGNSLLYEQPHTNRLTSTIENVMDEVRTSEFQEYWQKISCLDTKSWTNLMHIHTLRLVMEHDQPKYKNIHYQNANGRYTHVQCRRALSAVSNFIKSYASFALLEDTTYIKFIYNNDDDLREIETSATKGFIVIRINKLLPIIVIYLMFTSGILDSHRIEIVSYLERQLVNCRFRNSRTSAGQSENILRSKTIYPSSEACCILIKSPLERMLKVYSRNIIGDFLIHNWAYGLPGSCPYTAQSTLKLHQLNSDGSVLYKQQANGQKEGANSQSDGLINRYNLVFGKYLYGIRIIQTVSNLPHDAVSLLAANVLSKISAILVNIRIKQGFHIAFNNSGILNLVVELAMKDHSNPDHISNCLCQYIVFPPTVINTAHSMHTALANSHVSNMPASKPASLSGSLANSERYMKNVADSESHLGEGCGEIKIIKEYWIEQQYGISTQSEAYHRSLQNMRYSEVVDQLFLTDSSIFECLLTYDLLQLLCDKLSPFYNLDTSFIQAESKAIPIFSPTPSTTSSMAHNSSSGSSIPSTLMEGDVKGTNSKIPLLELEYQFSLFRFLDYCQLASLSILLFKEFSDFYQRDPDESKNIALISRNILETAKPELKSKPLSESKNVLGRKMSVDMNDLEGDHIKREHRCSYQHDNISANSYNYTEPIYGVSLNHMFLETLHKRVSQMHDKELKISEYDRKKLPMYLKRRKLLVDKEVADESGDHPLNEDPQDESSESDEESQHKASEVGEDDGSIEWRCFLRKGNQDNLLIVLMPASLSDVTKWLKFANTSADSTSSDNQHRFDLVCPMFVFKCSSTMINDHILSFLCSTDEVIGTKSKLESDLALHFGQPCKYMSQLIVYNDELNPDILPINRDTTSNNTSSDEKTIEVVHFRAFLRKIKNTVLKSRFSSLNDAYLSELFINKDDILYYINNIDTDTQKKYHVSTQLRNLSDFIKLYKEYNDSLPKEPTKNCNNLLNSILLQKCGLFINQPIARFNEANPLIRQLHDKKLLFLMRCNYKIELPFVEDNLANSIHLKHFIKLRASNQSESVSNSSTALSSLLNEPTSNNNHQSSSLSKSEGARMIELKSGSIGTSGSPSIFSDKTKALPTLRLGANLSNSAISPNSFIGDGLVLEAFRGQKICSIKEVIESPLLDIEDISSRHEAHMAEVLRRTGERKESHHYRRVLKSKTNHSQSHSAIDQALKRVDSLGRLEHFCLTPLLFSPSWRSRLAPVRDHTIESNNQVGDELQNDYSKREANQESSSSCVDGTRTAEEEAENQWHQMVCNNYIKEYEQYIQTLGFNSVQMRYQIQTKGSSQPSSLTSSIRTPRNSNDSNLRSLTAQSSSSSSRQTGIQRVNLLNQPRGSISSNQALTTTTFPGSYNTGYLIKFLNSGCLVFKVGFCKPYVYSILYSIEGERFNNSNMKMNMTAFLDELDNIKVTMHLHSFTYDYHLRSIYSYISGRQLTFSPGYHLISFLDEFRKYYQKAPNYARNHILCGEINVSGIKVTGQQLYNYIVTHNSAYNMDILEMSPAKMKLAQSGNLEHEQRLESAIGKEVESHSSSRSHANDYVLVELEREKVRYRDGKDPDIFDCGLLITHDNQETNSPENSLTLKYFLLLTNQRDLYPKLIHTYESIISSGCHRPIRLAQQLAQSGQKDPAKQEVTKGIVPSDNEDIASSELQSSAETSGPHSILSTTTSIQSSNSGIQFANKLQQQQQEDVTLVQSATMAEEFDPKSLLSKPEILIDKTSSFNSSCEVALTEVESIKSSGTTVAHKTDGISIKSKLSDKNEVIEAKKKLSSVSNNNNERTICDEEITYLGYFSSDEMDMLRFLQEKTANLRVHIDEVVRQAEIHYRRDYLWHKLMQRNSSSSKTDEIPLSLDEIIQLLSITDAIELTLLDPQLIVFTTMHINWYMTLIKAFTDFKQSSSIAHRIYVVKASKLLLLFIDPKCTASFILLTIDHDRSSVEMNMLIKDKQECRKILEKNNSNNSEDLQQQSSSITELDQDCQHLINDFINFCSTFMWSTLLS